MKKIFLKIVKAVLFPFLWCYKCIKEAPILDINNNLIDFSDMERYYSHDNK